MSADWLKMECDTPEKPELLAIAAELEIPPDQAFGLLFRVWRWFDRQTVNGNAAGVTATLLDLHVGARGVAAAMQRVGWLETTESGLRLPNFERHNGQTAKRRALTARRVARHRTGCNALGNAQGNAMSNAAGATSALARERERERSSSSAAECVDGKAEPSNEVRAQVAALVDAGLGRATAQKLASQPEIDLGLIAAARETAEIRLVGKEGNLPGLMLTLLNNPPADMLARAERARKAAAREAASEAAAKQLERDRAEVGAIPRDCWAELVKQTVAAVRQRHPYAHPERDFERLGQQAGLLPANLISAAAATWRAMQWGESENRPSSASRRQVRQPEKQASPEHGPLARKQKGRDELTKRGRAPRGAPAN